MLKFLFVLIGISIATGVYFLYQTLSNEPDSTNGGVNEVVDRETPADNQIELSRTYTANTGVFQDGYLFTMQLPTGTEVRVEGTDFYRIIYTGTGNESPALTNGVGIGMAMIKKSASTSLEAFVEQRFEMETNTLSTTYTYVDTYGRSAYRFDVESELGGPTEHIYFTVDDEHVIFISVSLYGTTVDRARYQSMVVQMLQGLTFLQVGESGDTSLIEVSSPSPGSTITSPLVVSGEARGGWYFEATFPVVIVDWDGRIIGEGYASAEKDWMTESFVPFAGEISFESIGTSTSLRRGTVIFKRANASGLPEHDAAVEIPVVFGI